MSLTWCPNCGSPFSNPHRSKGISDAIPFEVAQLDGLTRQMDDWQCGGLWLSQWRLSPRQFAMRSHHEAAANGG
jgi:hypothetical protein